MTKQHHHRSGPLKQKNKKHKNGKHNSKSSLHNIKGGIIDNIINTKSIDSIKHTIYMNRIKRKQLRLSKNEDNLIKNNIFINYKNGYGPPKVIAIISLSNNNHLNDITNEIKKNGLSINNNDQTMIYIPKYKQKLMIYECNNNIMLALELAKIADIILFVINVTKDTINENHLINKEGDQIISNIRSQGLPSVIGMVQGINLLNGKHQNKIKMLTQRFFKTEFNNDIKIVDSDYNKLIRVIYSTPCKVIHWRENRTYMIANDIKYESNDNDNTSGTVLLTGYLRGKPLSVNQLVYVADMGTYQLSKITYENEMNFKKLDKDNMLKSNDNNNMDENGIVNNDKVVVLPDPLLQEDLRYEAEEDPFSSEQTWPTEDEVVQMNSFVTNNNNNNEINKKINGMSDYQSSWIVDDNMNDDEMNDTNSCNDDKNEIISQDFCKLNQHIPSSSTCSNIDDDDLMMDNEHDELNETQREILVKRYQDAMDDKKFPDEVYIPTKTLGKIRYARYRGLQSMRTSHWDPKESLPKEYARIYQFKNFTITQKRIMDKINRVQKQSENNKSNNKNNSDKMEVDMDNNTNDKDNELKGYVPAGQYVTLHLKNVSFNDFEKKQNIFLNNKNKNNMIYPFIVSSLLKHENRLSVLNFSIQQSQNKNDHDDDIDMNSDSDKIIKSKDEMIFYCGFCKFYGSPIYSEQNLNSNKSKFLRFLPDSGWSIATVYGPTTYQPCPVLMFKKTQYDDSLHLNFTTSDNNALIASGALINVDPDRIVLKRIVVTGVPVKVKKRKAVIRYMFHSPEDIQWFKPIELVTKHGMTGHITESLGTHGDFKAIFNRPIKQHDTVCLHLYKRVYPKMIDSS